MLLLTRRIQEKLMIGDDVTVVVLGISGNQVRIGIEAPRSLPVHREEIYLRIQREQGIEVEEKVYGEWPDSADDVSSPNFNR